MESVSTDYLQHPEVQKFFTLVEEFNSLKISVSFEKYQSFLEKIKAQRSKIPIFLEIRIKSHPKIKIFDAILEACACDRESPVSIVPTLNTRAKLSANSQPFVMPKDTENKYMIKNSKKLLQYIFQLAIIVLQRKGHSFPTVQIKNDFNNLKTGKLVTRCFFYLKNNRLTPSDKETFLQSEIGQLLLQQARAHRDLNSK